MNNLKPSRQTQDAQPRSLDAVVRALTPAFLGLIGATIFSAAIGDNPAASTGMMLGMMLTVGILKWKQVL